MSRRLSTSERLDRMVTEKDFQSQVIQLARLLGWRVAHFRSICDRQGIWRTPVQADGAGWPDLFMVRRDRAIAAELKRELSKAMPEQDIWLYKLAQTCVETYIWRPSDLRLGTIQSTLRPFTSPIVTAHETTREGSPHAT